MKRCFALLALAVAWCYGTSFAPIPVAVRTTLYVPLLGVVASIHPNSRRAMSLSSPGRCVRQSARAKPRSPCCAVMS